MEGMGGRVRSGLCNRAQRGLTVRWNAHALCLVLCVDCRTSCSPSVTGAAGGRYAQGHATWLAVNTQLMCKREPQEVPL